MTLRAASVLLLASLIAGCAGYDPGGLMPGAPVSAIVERMGPPTGERPLPNGGKRLEYARGPFGKHTYMLDVDAQGRLSGWQQVLTEARFNALMIGTPGEQVLFDFGRPAQQQRIGRQHLTVWSYRYETPFCQWFQVSVGDDGKVVETGYGIDPMCDYNDHDNDARP
jgi:hypothetical protein